VTKLESPSPLVPSTTLMKFLVRITSSYGAPILDAPCGFGRNALALAARGYDVVAVDRDIDRLRFIENNPVFSRGGVLTLHLAKTRSG
jgi:predicted RNA methylase